MIGCLKIVVIFKIKRYRNAKKKIIFLVDGTIHFKPYK